jgi:hypothetical protein
MVACCTYGLVSEIGRDKERRKTDSSVERRSFEDLSVSLRYARETTYVRRVFPLGSVLSDLWGAFSGQKTRSKAK